MISITTKFISESFNSLSIPKMKKFGLLLFFFLLSLNTFGQYANKHYIAPAPWNYSSAANEFIVSTVSAGTTSVTVTKSDGTAVTTMSVTSGTPAVYRPTGIVNSLPANVVNTIYNDRGLIFTSASPIAVSIRNIESDQFNGGNPVNIKGNAALASYGNEGSGTSFRVGYYRANFAGLTAIGAGALAQPVYSVMAIHNNTVVSKNGTALVTLQAGQSYLFQTPIGDLITATKPVVMNSGSWRDAPGGCGDGVFDQIPPNRVLGKNYLVVRGSGTAGTGTNRPEQTLFIATENNTTVTATNYNVAGTVTGTTTYTLATAGSYQNIFHGDAATAYTATTLSANKNIIVYSGTAQSCEVDMSALPPISACAGSFKVETKRFLAYNNTTVLPYFGYVLITDPTAVVSINGTNLETLGGVRRQLGTSGNYLIDFTNTQLGNPTNLVFTSTVRMSVSMVQQGAGYSMAAYLSSFNDTLTPIEAELDGSGCVTLLTAEPGFSPYQWYYNGILIPGATSQTYQPTGFGNYSVSGTRTCGLTAPSSEFFVDCVAINAIDDGTAISPFATVVSGTTLSTSVKANDLLGNVLVTNVNTTVTPGIQGPLTIDSLGIITVASGTSNGVYPIQYQLCSTQFFPTVCDLATAYVKVTVLPGSISGNQSICSGDNPAAFTSTSPGVGEGTMTYRWESAVSPFTTWSPIAGATAETYDAPAGLTVTTQYRRITITLLGESDPSTAVIITISVPTLSGVVINSGCTNSNGSITVTSNATSFLWSDGVTTKNRTALAAGNYSVTATDASGCTATASFVVNTSSVPQITSATVSNVNCFGQNTGAISPVMIITGTRTYTYAWTGPASFTATTLNISSLAAGTYNLTITASNGCKGYYSATITQPASAFLASTTKNDVSCFGGSDGAINLIVSGGTAPYTYAWTGPNSFTSASQDLSSLRTGTYNVTITDTKGCTTIASVIVGTNATALVATLSSNSPICSGGNAVFTITGTAGNIVAYTGDSSGIATIGAGGTVDVTVAGVTSNTTLNLTDVSNGTCNQALASTTTVTLNTLPSASLTGGGVYCPGGAGVAVGLHNSTIGINYQLQLNGVNDGTPVAGTGSAISFGLKTLAGTYTVIATNTTTTCTAAMTGSAFITICTGSIEGSVWYDINGDGMNDVGENGLVGATIRLDPGTPDNPADDIITTTNPTGNYVFLNLPDGIYTTLIEVSTITTGIPAGYNSAQLVPTFDADGLGTHKKSTFTIVSGQTIFNQDFAFVKPSDYTTSGHSGGVESESLGDAISKIYVGRKKNSVPTEFVKTNKNLFNKSILKTTQASGKEQTLFDMFPKELVSGNIANETSPKDILDYTIADQVLSVDFSIGGKTKAVVLGIKTSDKIYNHTKASCDRLRGAEILNIQKIQLQGYNFLMQGLKQRNGVIEYAISFAVAKNNNDTSYSIQTNWYVNAYTKFNDVYNFQVWSTRPADTQKLVSDILNNLKSYIPVNQIDEQKIPETYASKIYREKGELIVKLRSTTVLNTAEISMVELYSETANNIKFRDNTLSTEIKQELRVDIADGYEYDGLIKVNSQVEDAFYHADGNWGLDFDKRYTKINNYFVWNNFDRKYSDEEYSINRNVEIKATSEYDYLTVYKSLLPGTLSADYSEYKYLAFTAKGSGLTELGLIKSSIEDWKSQYRIMVDLTKEEQTYYIPFDAFISANSKESMIPNDLTTLTFTFLPVEAKTKELDMFISNVKFVKVAGDDGIVINKKLKFDNSFLAYPNPSKGKVNLMLFSNSDNNADIILSDLLGRTIYRSSADLKVGRNELDFNLNVTPGTYIVKVSSKDTEYGTSKIIFR